ncbi:hypothetical protein EDB19DRAFT_2022527 [Suillus lakei]|nr:hypothetical protein EDB19DRAFT_2022527 [Suillus lakei]
MPKKKRTRATKAQTRSSRTNVASTSKAITVKRRKGKLELLPSMNMDILCQILSFLRPMDLLNLSRITKAFRSLLMQKSSAFIWREARRQIANFPNCPTDLSEPQYANLAFYPHCHGCGKGVRSVIWPLRARYCSTCLKTWTITWSEIHASGPPCKNKNNCKWFAIPAADVKMGTRKAVLLCLRSQFEALKLDLSGKNKKDQQLIIHQGKASTRAIDEHAKTCAQWEMEIAHDRKEELEDIKSTREQEIMTWVNSEFIRDAQRFRWNIAEHPVFKEAKPLTPRSWIRVRKALTNHIHELRKNNMATFVYPTRHNILRTAYQQYLEGSSSQSDSVEPVPGWHFLIALKRFDDIIKAPPQVPFRDNMFSSALAKLPEILSPLRTKAELKLSILCLLPTSSNISGGGHDFTFRRLRLASSFFLCGRGLFAYPEVLHYAFSIMEAPSVLDDASVLEMEFWNIGRGSQISRCKSAAAIVSLCGLDPTIATPDDMEAQSVVIRCSQCHSTHSDAMTWRTAIMHAHHLSHDDTLSVVQGTENVIMEPHDI